MKTAKAKTLSPQNIPAEKNLPRFLSFYKNSDFVIRLKVRFIYYFCLSFIGILCVVLFYSASIQITSNPGGTLDWPILIGEASGLLVVIVCLLVLGKGYYSVAAHLLLSTSLFITWVIMLVDKGGDPIKKLDSVVFSLSILSMTPLILSRGKRFIPLYFCLNAAALLLFILFAVPDLTIPLSSKIDYFADTIISLLFMGIVSYNIFSIYKTSLDKISSENNDRKKAEAALRISETRFRQLFNQAPVPMAFIAANGTVIDVNQSVAQVFGYEKEELFNLDTMWSTVFPDTAARNSFLSAWQEKIKKAGESDTPISPGETEISCKDGSVKSVIISAARLDHGIIISLTDMTELKKAAEEKEKLQTQLNQAHKMDSIGKLAGGVAHDFNNMLGVILGYADMALERIPEADPLYEEIQQIIHAANRSANLTRQLLTFARKQTISPKLLDLNLAIGNLLAMLKRMIGEDIELAWKPGTGLWPVMVDPSQVDQVLANLCVNARDAITGIGKITIETGNVTLDADFCEKNPGFIPGRFVRISVSDTGTGMDEQTKAQIFEPFFTTKQPGKGTGLGLATIYGIIKQNDGFITVSSEPGYGTDFKLYLPIGNADAKALPLSDYTGKEIYGNETILVVEDEPSLLEQTCAMLQGLGYRILRASNPLEALSTAETCAEPIHMILSDVIMPDMNGKDLVEKIHALFPGIRYLFMSGYAADVIAHHGVLDDDVPFMQKPFSKKDLAFKIRGILDSVL